MGPGPGRAHGFGGELPGPGPWARPGLGPWARPWQLPAETVGPARARAHVRILLSIYVYVCIYVYVLYIDTYMSYVCHIFDTLFSHYFHIIFTFLAYVHFLYPQYRNDVSSHCADR